ncbi:MAG: hypothetical protein Q4A03_02430 [Rothia sp. (in: high G+C Gram-positive bacteria)]|uniref:hypothetical protein n=1 Tax=Rothia sp. (in: high G+C Gram-positive bacteria) TaxID=1885016 RepID=UPI0026F70CB0|nr:hypothetical protein [Rothia sp. (in: high G+C Gram-positive bacteria)]
MSDKEAVVVFHVAGGSPLRFSCSSEVAQALHGALERYLLGGGDRFSLVLCHGCRARVIVLNRHTTYEFEYQRGFSSERTKVYDDVFGETLDLHGLVILSSEMEPLRALPVVDVAGADS